MAYPGEKEHVDYLDYVEKVSTGDSGDLPTNNGRPLTKEEYRKHHQKKKPKRSVLNRMFSG